MKRKTLTTSFLDFSGGAEGSFMGTVLIREVAYPNRAGDRYLVRLHVANDGFYPALDLDALMPDCLRRIFRRAQYRHTREDAVARLKDFEAQAGRLFIDGDGTVIYGRLQPPASDIHIREL